MEKKNEQIIISIIIPVYNLESYIIQTIESIFNNNNVSSNDLEVIIVNDGSTDNSQKLIEDYIELHRESLLSLYLQKNQGVSAARNNGLEKAKGKYVWFIDGDDAITANSIEHIKPIAENNNFDLIRIGEIIHGILYDDNKIIATYQNNPDESSSQIIEAYNSLSKGYDKGHTGCIWNCKFLLKNKLQYPVGIKNNEDLCFLLQASLLAKKAYINPSFRFYIYREGIAISASRGKHDYLRYDNIVNDQFQVLNIWLQFKYKHKEKLNKEKFKLFDEYLDAYICNNILGACIASPRPLSLTLYCVYKLKAMHLYPINYTQGASRFRVWIVNNLMIPSWIIFRFWKVIKPNIK